MSDNISLKSTRTHETLDFMGIFMENEVFTIHIWESDLPLADSKSKHIKLRIMIQELDFYCC